MKYFKSILFLSAVLALSLSMASCKGKTKTESDNATTKTEQPTKMKIKTKQGKEYTSAYVCPMHCEGSGADKPGDCPVCGMKYVENKDAKKEDGHEGHNH